MTWIDTIDGSTISQLVARETSHPFASLDNVLPAALRSYLVCPSVTDIIIDAHNMWIEVGQGLQREDTPFASARHLDTAIRALAARTHGRIDANKPWMDAVITDPHSHSWRVHAIIAPASPDGPTLSLRALHTSHRDMDWLAEHMNSDDSIELLKDMITTRRNFCIVGPTGSGKTTVLAALLSHTNPSERIILLEDTPELSLSSPCVTRLCSRPPNGEQAGEVTLSMLVKQSLRMRPDRLVIGEVRGTETADLLEAISTGHNGSAFTVHGSDAASAILRIQSLCGQAGMSEQLSKGLLAQCRLDIITLGRTPDNQRCISGIDRVTPEHHDLRLHQIYPRNKETE